MKHFVFAVLCPGSRDDVEHSTSRNTGQAQDTIRATLADVRANGWSDLGSVPEEWTRLPVGQIAVSEAGDRAQELATIAALEM